MADDTRDPREAVLGELTGHYFGPHELTEALARLDAADPLRQLFPELVEVLDALLSPAALSSRDYAEAEERGRHILSLAIDERSSDGR